MAFRKANGLCYTCGEKWIGRAHKCPEQVPLHVVQELFDAFQLDQSSDSESLEGDTDHIEDCAMKVQQSAMTQPVKRRKTIRFKEKVGKRDLLILLDSGSAGTFISEEVANQFSSLLSPCDTLQFSTADGTPMVSDKHIEKFQWIIQGQVFSYNVRVLPLKCFDMIIGADWLEDHSPT